MVSAEQPKPEEESKKPKAAAKEPKAKAKKVKEAKPAAEEVEIPPEVSLSGHSQQLQTLILISSSLTILSLGQIMERKNGSIIC